MTYNRRLPWTEYQRRHRAKKKAAHLCQENGCHTSTLNYRCGPCALIKNERERFRKARRVLQ